jgi:arsenate reductase
MLRPRLLFTRQSGKSCLTFSSSAPAIPAAGRLPKAGCDTSRATGLKPGTVHPLAIEVMRESGVDISGQRSKDVATLPGRRFACIITVCDRARDTCPIFPGPSLREHWPIEDPATAQGSHEERLRVFRKVRDNIAARLLQFLASQTKGSSS